MSSLIEQAAARLAQLKQSGVPTPRPATAPSFKPVMPAASWSDAVPAAFAGDATHGAAAPSGPVLQSRRVDLDLDDLMARGFIPPGAPQGIIMDEFRVIKRPLLNNALGRGVPKVHHGNLIMLTSAMPGEGKTFTAVNLALSIAAEMDSTVLLVDADVANASVQRTLGMDPGLGLLDVLAGRCTMSEAIVRTNIDKLTVMHAGTPQDRATEMLGSQAMMDLLEQMASRYQDRIIVFDLPPLLLATEARVMAGHAGQLVIVVRSHYTTESQLQHALATVEQVPIKMALLNQATSSDQAEHGYGYGYGRRYAQGRTNASAERAPGPAKAAPAAPSAVAESAPSGGSDGTPQARETEVA